MRSEGLLYSWKTFLRDAVIMMVGHNSKPRDLKRIAITWNHKHGTDCGIGCTLPTHITFSKYVDKRMVALHMPLSRIEYILLVLSWHKVYMPHTTILGTP